MRAHLPPCLSLFDAARNAGTPHAAAPWRRDQRAGSTACCPEPSHPQSIPPRCRRHNTPAPAVEPELVETVQPDPWPVAADAPTPVIIEEVQKPVELPKPEPEPGKLEPSKPEPKAKAKPEPKQPEAKKPATKPKSEPK